MDKKTAAPVGEGFNLKEYISYADDAVVSKTLIDKGIGNITLFSFDKDQGLSEHTSPFDAVVHILDGEAEITIGGEKRNVKTGEMIIMPANIPHALYAQEKYKMLLTMLRKKVEKTEDP
jgi:quercetin dioxygenase-like cupin family protein